MANILVDITTKGYPVTRLKMVGTWHQCGLMDTWLDFTARLSVRQLVAVFVQMPYRSTRCHGSAPGSGGSGRCAKSFFATQLSPMPQEREALSTQDFNDNLLVNVALRKVAQLQSYFRKPSHQKGAGNVFLGGAEISILDRAKIRNRAKVPNRNRTMRNQRSSWSLSGTALWSMWDRESSVPWCKLFSAAAMQLFFFSEHGRLVRSIVFEGVHIKAATVGFDELLQN